MYVSDRPLQYSIFVPPADRQIPGLIHAWYIIAKFPEPDYDYEVLNQDAEGNGRVTYVVVHGNHRHGNSGRGGNSANRHHVTTDGAGAPTNGGVQSAAPKIADNMNYGTASTAGAPAASAPAPAAAGSSSAAAAGPSDNGGEGGSDGPPPSYAQVVAGDNKVQSQE